MTAEYRPRPRPRTDVESQSGRRPRWSGSRHGEARWSTGIRPSSVTRPRTAGRCRSPQLAASTSSGRHVVESASTACGRLRRAVRGHGQAIMPGSTSPGPGRQRSRTLGTAVSTRSLWRHSRSRGLTTRAGHEPSSSTSTPNAGVANRPRGTRSASVSLDPIADAAGSDRCPRAARPTPDAFSAARRRRGQPARLVGERGSLARGSRASPVRARSPRTAP